MEKTETAAIDALVEDVVVETVMAVAETAEVLVIEKAAQEEAAEQVHTAWMCLVVLSAARVSKRF